MKQKGMDIALDNFENIYLVGATNSTNFPTTPGPYNHSINEQDIFISNTGFIFIVIPEFKFTGIKKTYFE